MLAIRPTINVLKHTNRFKKTLKTCAAAVDPYRDTSLRYMGYANEVGEAFTAFIPEWGVPASYCVAASYVIFDTIDKGQKAYETADEENKIQDALKMSAETMTWQMLASVFWPGSIIRVVVNMSDNMLVAKLTENEQFAHVLATLFGLMAIPMIIKPIDNTVDKVMETSISKVIHGKIKTPEDASTAFMTSMGSFSVPPIMYSLAAFIKTK
jgi:mitochondrial fission process protein 1